MVQDAGSWTPPSRLDRSCPVARGKFSLTSACRQDCERCRNGAKEGQHSVGAVHQRVHVGTVLRAAASKVQQWHVVRPSYGSARPSRACCKPN